jgi:hypothetical protein
MGIRVRALVEPVGPGHVAQSGSSGNNVEVHPPAETDDERRRIDNADERSQERWAAGRV